MLEGQKSTFVLVKTDTHSCEDARVAVGYLDTREGDSGGGVGADHQGDECGAEVSKHVGELRGKQQLSADF